MRLILRPYQTSLLFDAIEAFANGVRRVLLVLPTGGGKTVIFKTLAEQEPEPTVILAHRRRLIQQASAGLSVPHGIVQPGRPETLHRLQVASIQTIVRRPARPFGLIIADEAHHSVAGQWRKFLDAHPTARILGVTATPERLDGRGLGDVFDAMITGPSTADLIRDGYLCPVRVFTQNTAGLSSVRTVAGEFDAGQVAAVMDRPGLLGDAVDHYRRHCDGQPGMAFCASVAHAEHVAAEFRSAGYRSEAVHGGLADKVADARMASLGTTIDVLTACDLVSEGVDIPSVSCVMLLSKTASLGKYLQWIGRGFRPAPGKSRLTVLDHAGNVDPEHGGHGMPDAPREWSLAGRKKRDKNPPPVRQCPECFATHSPAPACPACPACGHLYTVEASLRDIPKAEAGELVEVTTEPLPRLADVLKAAKTYADVEAIRRSRGYKPGWTRAIMAHKRIYEPHTTAIEDFA